VNVSSAQNVTFINVTTVPALASDLYGFTYDPNTGFVYGAYGASNVAVIAGATNTLAAVVPAEPGALNGAPTSVAFDPLNDYTYVAAEQCGCVFVVGVGPPPSLYNLTFTESGLPMGLPWSVRVASSLQGSNESTISYSLRNGSYAYSVINPKGYAAAPPSGNVTIAGESVPQPIEFSRVSPGYFPVYFIESGLPAGAIWSVTLDETSNSSSQNSLYFLVTNGSYTYTAHPPGGYNVLPTSGTVTVSGSEQTIDLNFQQVAHPSTGPTALEVESILLIVAGSLAAGILGFYIHRRGARRPVEKSGDRAPKQPES
jgi:hypothetical protein